MTTQLSQAEIERLRIAVAKLHHLHDWIEEDTAGNHPVDIRGYVDGLKAVRMEINSKLPDINLETSKEFSKIAYDELVTTGVIKNPDKEKCKEI